MPGMITKMSVRFLLLITVIVSGCGNGQDQDGAAKDGLPEDMTILKVALCPKDGGRLKFLHMDSMKVETSDLDAPAGIRCLVGMPSSSRFAAVTEEAIYILREKGKTGIGPIPIPRVSQNLRVLPTRDGVFIMDRNARRLLRVDTVGGTVDFDRTLQMQPEDFYYFPSQSRIVVVMKKGAGGVLSAFATGGVESMSINMESIVCSTGAVEEGMVYVVTESMGGPRLEAYRAIDLSRALEIELEREPGSIIHNGKTGRLYLYYPDEGIVQVVERDGGKVAAEIPLESSGAGDLYSDDSGRYVYLLMRDTGHLVAISTRTNKVAGEIESQDGDTRLITAPDSRFILLQDNKNSRIRLYDGDDFQLLRVFMEEDPVEIALLKEGEAELPAGETQVAGQKRVERSSAPPREASSLESADWEESFTLQLFSSDSPASSERISNLLALGGYPAYVEKAKVEGKGTWYRVKMGEFVSREDAAAVGEHIKRMMGLAFWVTGVEDPRSLRAAGKDVTPAGQDMDADGVPEIAVVDHTGIVRLFSLRGSRFVPRWRHGLPENQTLCGSITYGDENGDGLPEARLPLCPLNRFYVVTWTGTNFTGGSG